MKNVVRDLSVRNKLLLIAAATLIGLLSIAAISINALEESLLEDRRLKTRHTVDVAHSIVEHYQRQAAAGTLDEEQARQAALETLKSLRYGDNLYFWVNDLQPRVIMHPMTPSMEGQSVAEVQDANGLYLFREFVQLVERDGSGFVDYLWPKPGSSEAVRKTSYVKGFQPWQWVIGSGIYLDDVDAAIWQIEKRLALIFALFITVVAATIWLLARAITGPVEALRRTMQLVAEDGNLDRRLSVTQRDELGQMAESFNAFLGKLQNFVVGVQNDVTRLALAGDNLSGSSVQIAHQMRRLHDETTQAATAMTEMTSSSSEVARNVEVAAEHSQDTDSQAEQGKATVEQNLDATDQLVIGVRGASENVARLATDAEEIGSIIDVINGIAEQTNLLALNAAIEAARAGEQGRGFAVVADEVRTLAQRTQKSTGDIQQKIERLRSGVNATTEVMASCLRQTDDSLARAREAKQALLAIKESASRISDLNREIASAALEQSTVSEDINVNFNNINSVASEIASVTDNASLQTGQLGATLSDVVASLGQFHSASDWHYQISAAKTSHMLWKIRVRGFLDGHIQLDPSEAVSHHECKFGRWYDRLKKEDSQAATPLKPLERPHEKLHALVKTIIETSQAGRKTEAESLYCKLDEISTEILAVLDRADAAGEPAQQLRARA
ncbi:MAG: cache domain-containing protein [Gammaproteobacteria bacterium]|nr:cache domain-containing protein [Gammaproteobacteria bacterium]